jgi:phage terminase small subunit
MSVLKNAKHERFSQEIAGGKSQAEAYELAGYSPSEQHASRLARNGKVRARIAELLGRVAEGVVLTRQWVLERLIENANRAMQAEEVKDSKGIPTGEYRYEGSVANRALELLGKELCMFVDRKEVGKPGEFESMNADQLRDYIRREAEELGLGATPLAQLNGSGKPH